MGANSPGSSRLDGSEALENLILPYDRRTKELDDTPRLVDGQDVWVTPRGTIAKRPAIRTEDFTGKNSPGKAVRLWVYKTLENPAKVYVLGSFYLGSYYTMYYFRIGTSSAWTTLGDLRQIHRSKKPHEIVFANGKAYVKGFPDDVTQIGTTPAHGGDTVTLRPTNGDFETGDLTNWSSTGSGSTDSASTDAERTGTYGMQSILAGAVDGGRSNATVTAAMLPPIGDTIVVSAWVKIASGTPTNVKLTASGAGTTTSSTTASAAAFTQLTVEMVRTHATNPLIIALVGNGTGTVYWDDVQVFYKERLGSVVFDGTDASLHYWGVLPPAQSQAGVLTASGGWTATTNVDVNFGWRYAYSWKTSTGHISSRSPLKIPAGQGQLSGSDTGAFTNKKPTVTVQGAPSTTLIPEIAVWRTFDGGGVFPKVTEVTNTGSGSINYEDNDSEGTAGQPKTDFELDAADLAPFSTINSPPPTVAAPLVTGTDPIAATSNIVEYAGRIWYFIGNILVFSGNEEVSNGIPQESFPSGLQGNFIRFKNPGRRLAATSEALYIITDENVMWLTGSTRQDFRVEPLLSSIGAAEGHNAAVCPIRDLVAWLTDDNEIALLRGKTLKIISGPLGTSLKSIVEQTTSTNPTAVTLCPHFQDGQAWLFVGVEDTTAPANSRIFVYDLSRDAWNPPWVVEFTAMTSGRIRESDNKRELLIATLPTNGTGDSVGLLDFDAFTDQLADGSANYAPSLTTNLFKIPAGNHINLLTRKGAKPLLRSLVIERTKYTSDTDPTVQYRLDEFSGSWSDPNAGPSPPTPTAQHTSYYELYYDVGSQASRAQIKVSKTASTEQFELQSIGFLWDAPAGS